MILKTYPEIFTKRIKMRYALIPKIVENKLIWLEYYHDHQYYGVNSPNGGMMGSKRTPYLNKWITTDLTLINNESTR